MSSWGASRLVLPSLHVLVLQRALGTSNRLDYIRQRTSMVEMAQVRSVQVSLLGSRRGRSGPCDVRNCATTRQPRGRRLKRGE